MDVSILIKTFERQASLVRLLKSLKQRGFQGPVCIADDSRHPYREEIEHRFPDLVSKYIELPFDSGVSKGRNVLLSEIETKYFLLCDDDFIFDERTNIEWMEQTLENNEIDLLGGLFYEPRGLLKHLFLQAPIFTLQTGVGSICRGSGVWVFREDVRRYHGLFEVEKGVLYRQPIGKIDGPVRQCDYVHNFFMANTLAVRDAIGGWDERLKLKEHWDFFFRAKQAGLRVAGTEQVGVTHLPTRLGDLGNENNYLRYRVREEQFNAIALEKHGICKLK